MSHESPPENKCQKCGTPTGDSIQYCEKCKTSANDLIREAFAKHDKWLAKQKQERIDQANQR